MNTETSCSGHTIAGEGEVTPRVSFSSDETGLAPPRVLILLCDIALEPRSPAITWNAFRCAGATVEFATERGTMSKAEQRTLVRSWFRDALVCVPVLKTHQYTSCQDVHFMIIVLIELPLLRERVKKTSKHITKWLLTIIT